jgi:hypothetical protein
MAHKKILPKKLGPVKIPKNLRKMGDKALADPRVASILSEAVASVAAVIAARKTAKSAPNGEEPSRSSTGRKTLHGVTEVVSKAFEEVVHIRTRSEEAAPKSKLKGAKGKSVTRASASTTESETDGDQMP